MKTHPKCKYCASSASFVCAQSTNQGKTARWVFVCKSHEPGWNDGSDWIAPIYSLVRANPEA